MITRSEVSSPQSLLKVVQTLGKGSGLPTALIKANPPELLHANAEMEQYLQIHGLADASGQAAASFLTGPFQAPQTEVTPLDGATPGAIRLVVIRSAPESRLQAIVDRVARRHALSPCEHKELSHLARGLSIKDSARTMGLSPETVRVRRKRVYRKVGLSGHEALLARLVAEALGPANLLDIRKSA